MAENNDYQKNLAGVLAARADWLERSELPLLKEEIGCYHSGFASLYNLYLKKGLLHEDPYKEEAKIVELEVPSSGSFSESEKMEQLSQRFANYDNQLRFLVNFCQFNAEFLNMERIKRILGLINYVDWLNLTTESPNQITRAAAVMTNQIKTGADTLIMIIISESLAILSKSYAPIIGCLKVLTDYQREAYKADLRDAITGLSANDASNISLIRDKFTQARPEVPFYQDLAEEVIKEDYSNEGPQLREAVLKKLQADDNKPREVKLQVSTKRILLEGIQGLGGTAGTFTDVLGKIDENHAILQSSQQGLLQKFRKLMQELMHILFHKEPDPVIYHLKYIDPVKNHHVREKLNYGCFRGDMEQRIRSLTPIASMDAVVSRLNSLQEEQLVDFLERNIREVQALHKTLNALDDFFKTAVDGMDRDRVRGIKPELATIKNAILRASSKRHEYSAQKWMESCTSPNRADTSAFSHLFNGEKTTLVPKVEAV